LTTYQRKKKETNKWKMFYEVYLIAIKNDTFYGITYALRNKKIELNFLPIFDLLIALIFAISKCI